MGCSTTPDWKKDYDENTRPNPASFGADGFTFQRPRKTREKNNFEFYYKKCSVADEVPAPVWRIWECTDP